MSRIQQCFKSLRANGRKALIPYITAGDPNLETTLGLMHALVSAGADILELGVPFSDPASDGPVIQQAVERALAKNTSLRDVLALVSRFRQKNQQTPVVLMGYLNPVEIMGYRHFAEAAREAGVDGVLIVDMPPEESHELLEAIRDTELDSIFLVAPTTREARARRICELSTAWIYYVSLKGVTGASNLDLDSVKASIASLRACSDLPIGVGFGVKDAQSAAAIAGIADAVVVGSALVSRIAGLRDGVTYTQQQLQEQVALIAEMRKAMDA